VVANELVDAFAAAVPFALAEMAGIEAFVRDIRPDVGGETSVLAATIRLTGSGGVGRFVLCFPTDAAAALAMRVLAGAIDGPPDAMVRDCLGEVANVAAGQAKTMLVGTPSHFDLSPPTVTDEIPGAGSPRSRIEFASEIGIFAALVWPAIEC
jgi:CheY-specific phosphatase CheX